MRHRKRSSIRAPAFTAQPLNVTGYSWKSKEQNSFQGVSDCVLLILLYATQNFSLVLDCVPGSGSALARTLALAPAGGCRPRTRCDPKRDKTFEAEE